MFGKQPALCGLRNKPLSQPVRSRRSEAKLLLDRRRQVFSDLERVDGNLDGRDALRRARGAIDDVLAAPFLMDDGVRHVVDHVVTGRGWCLKGTLCTVGGQ